MRHRVIHQRAGDELAVGAVDDLLHQGLRDPLREPAVDLAGHQRRRDPHAAIVDGHEVAHVHATRLAIDFDDGNVCTERIDELRRPEELRGLEPVLHSLRQTLGVGLGGDGAERERLRRHAFDVIASVGEHDVLCGRLEHRGGDAPRLVLHLQCGAEDGRAAHGEAARAAGAIAHRRVQRIAVADDDPVEGHAEMVGDDLRKRRLVALPVRGRPGERGDVATGLDTHDGALEGAEAAHLDVARHADAQQHPIAAADARLLLVA